MTIKQHGGIFGRNPKFYNVEAEGTISADGDISSLAEIKGRSLSLVEPSASPCNVLLQNDEGSVLIRADGDFALLRANQFIFQNSGGGDRIDIVDGNLKPQSGNGIDFSATSGTGTSELFDDYEEGSFTPTVEGATTAGSGTYGNQLGYYTKVGRVVHFQIWIQVTSHTGTGTTKIMGLPFTSGGTSTSSGSASLGYAANLTLSSGHVAIAQVQYNGTWVVLQQYPTTGTATAIGVPVDGNMQVKLAGSYITA